MEVFLRNICSKGHEYVILLWISIFYH